MMRIALGLQYDGSPYAGWQLQPNQLTVQGEVEKAITAFIGQDACKANPVHTITAGRTDAGVHALAQVAAFTIANPIPVENLRKAMNRLSLAKILRLGWPRRSNGSRARSTSVAPDEAGRFLALPMLSYKSSNALWVPSPWWVSWRLAKSRIVSCMAIQGCSPCFMPMQAMVRGRRLKHPGFVHGQSAEQKPRKCRRPAHREWLASGAGSNASCGWW